MTTALNRDLYVCAQNDVLTFQQQQTLWGPVQTIYRCDDTLQMCTQDNYLLSQSMFNYTSVMQD